MDESDGHGAELAMSLAKIREGEESTRDHLERL
jgi:hypothetical protein